MKTVTTAAKNLSEASITAAMDAAAAWVNTRKLNAVGTHTLNGYAVGGKKWCADKANAVANALRKANPLPSPRQLDNRFSKIARNF